MIDKRGGHLCVPLPKGGIGKCGYLNELSYEDMKSRLSEYKALCQTYPRNGLGVEMHCSDVGLDDPSSSARDHVNAESR